MFVTLFFKECRQLLKSLTYYLFLLFMFLFFITQINDVGTLEKPIEGRDNYGSRYSDDKAVIIQSTLKELIAEYSNNSYVTYPVGFYKQVILNEKEQQKIENFLLKLMGISKEKWNIYLDSYNTEALSSTQYTMYTKPDVGNIQTAGDLTYEQFLGYMKQINKILGGGSKYAPKTVKSNAVVPLTYKEALKDFEDVVNKDHVSGAFARVFCDYLGIILGILPVFIAVTRGLRDKRAQASQVIFAKKGSSFTIVLSRYLAVVAMIFIPLLLLSMNPALKSFYLADTYRVNIDIFIYLKYIIGWLMPIVVFTVAVGFFLTELTDGPIGILIQGIFWIITIFTTSGTLIGEVGWSLVPRFNVLGNYSTYALVKSDLVLNRLVYSMIGLILIALTVVLYENKRKGAFSLYGKILPNRKNKL